MSKCWYWKSIYCNSSYQNIDIEIIELTNHIKVWGLELNSEPAFVVLAPGSYHSDCELKFCFHQDTIVLQAKSHLSPVCNFRSEFSGFQIGCLPDNGYYIEGMDSILRPPYLTKIWCLIKNERYFGLFSGSQIDKLIITVMSKVCILTLNWLDACEIGVSLSQGPIANSAYEWLISLEQTISKG